MVVFSSQSFLEKSLLHFEIQLSKVGELSTKMTSQLQDLQTVFSPSLETNTQELSTAKLLRKICRITWFLNFFNPTFLDWDIGAEVQLDINYMIYSFRVFSIVNVRAPKFFHRKHGIFRLQIWWKCFWKNWVIQKYSFEPKIEFF